MALLMNLPGIVGESTVDGHQGWLALASFTWGGARVARSMAAGSHRSAPRVWAPQLRPATVSRKADARTAMIWTAMITGIEFPMVKIEWLRTGQGSPVCYFAVEFRGVRIARIIDASTGEHPVESIELVYREITLGVRDVNNALSGSQDLVTYQIPQHAGG
jgi:type VI protein secretion system component Hcp